MIECERPRPSMIGSLDSPGPDPDRHGEQDRDTGTLRELYRHECPLGKKKSDGIGKLRCRRWPTNLSVAVTTGVS